MRRILNHQVYHVAICRLHVGDRFVYVCLESLRAAMDSVKKFFQEKKMDWKFKKAGEGHRLDEEKPRPTTSKPGKLRHEP